MSVVIGRVHDSPKTILMSVAMLNFWISTNDSGPIESISLESQRR